MISRRSLLKAIFALPLVSRIVPARRIVNETVEKIFIGRPTDIAYGIEGLPLPIVHKDFANNLAIANRTIEILPKRSWIDAPEIFNEDDFKRIVLKCLES